jgi:recombination protein RecA
MGRATHPASTTPNSGHAVDQAIAEIRRRFGAGAIMQMGDHGTALEVETVSTGALGLDLALGIGGYPRGRIVEIYGPESTGKSCLALHAVASVQRAGGRAAFIDAEHALDPSLARAIGVDMDALLVSQPDYGEEALEIASALVHTAGIGIVVVDSVAALVPKSEFDGDMGEAFIGLQARLMSQALRKLAGAINRSKTIVVFVNQLRERVGVMFGPTETTTGGRALKFYASVRLDVRRIETLKNGDQPIGQRIRVKVAKNKLAPPFRETQLDILFGRGIDTIGSLLDAALAAGVITRSGSWILYGDRQIGYGREAARQALIEDPGMAAGVERAVRGHDR